MRKRERRVGAVGFGKWENEHGGNCIIFTAHAIRVLHNEKKSLVEFDNGTHGH